MPVATPSFPSPLQSTLSLAKLPQRDFTPSIGTVFSKETQLSALLDQSDCAIRDLAILVSQRGVVFFRDQDISIEQQKTLVDRLGRESGRPAESSFHRHPLTDESKELGDEVQTIASNSKTRAHLHEVPPHDLPRADKGWHSDITFENHPSDYAALRLVSLPKVGGDTLWASGYEAYDRLSPSFREYLSTLTATHSGALFLKIKPVVRSPRGHPENNSTDSLEAAHPVIRTNPVTGWKSLFVNSNFTTRINEVSKEESDHLLKYLFDHVAHNHDLQVRFNWRPNSVAIWDNRSTLHNVTNDYGDEFRDGRRVVSVGERPYYDPNSLSRREALKDHGAGTGLA